MIKLMNATKEYRSVSGNKVRAVDNVTFEAGDGEMVAITGKSGAGKSTLLNLMAGLDIMTEGELHLNGERIDSRSVSAMAKYRNKNIGYIIQSFGLIDEMTVLDNAMLPLKYQKKRPSAEDSRARAVELLTYVGMADKLSKYPAELSGGECQRVAIARALVCDPPVILADEPTASLDDENENDILRMFDEMKNKGKTVIVITHDESVARRCDREIKMHGGKIIGNEE